jgi:hypothetical protein
MVLLLIAGQLPREFEARQQVPARPSGIGP